MVKLSFKKKRTQRALKLTLIDTASNSAALLNNENREALTGFGINFFHNRLAVQ